VYALLFADTGLTTGEISFLLVLWSIVGMVLEIPSGALADLVSRRALIVVAALCNGAAFAVWVLRPSFAVFAVGFVLWGVGGALETGTLDALLYDELTGVGAEDQYQRWAGLGESASLTGQVGATLAAPLLFDRAGYLGLGAVSAVACVAAAMVASTLPNTPRVDRIEVTPRSWFAMLRAGVGEAATHPPVRRLILVSAALLGFSSLDEFFPLVAQEQGVATALVPLLTLGTVVGQLVGSALAARTAPAKLAGVGVILSGGLIAAGALSGSPWGWLPIGVGYGMVQYATIVTDAALQHAVRGPARATVTSVTSLSGEVTGIGCYLAWGLAAGTTGAGDAMAWVCLPLPLVGLFAIRWMRGRVGPAE